MRCLYLVLLLLISFPAMALRPVEVSSANTKAWLIEDHSLPAFSMVIRFNKSGTAYDPEGKEGLANLFTKMLAEGAGNYDSRKFRELLQENAIELSIGADEDSLDIHLRSLSRNRDIAAQLLSLALGSPRFTAGDLIRIKKETMLELKSQEQNPGFVAGNQWRRIAYGNHPYSATGYPTEKSVQSIGRGDLVKFKENNLTKGNVQVSVVGDISAAETKKFVDEVFSMLPAQQKVKKSMKEAELAGGLLRLTKSDIPQSVIVFGFRGLKRSDPDYLSFYVLNHILGSGSFSSRLMEEVREKSGLTYGIYTALESMDYAGLLSGGFSTKNEDAVKAISKVKEEFAKLQASGVTETELRDAKSQITGSFALSLDTNMKVAGFLSTMQKYNLGIDYLEKRNSLFEAVTLQDVNRLAKEKINADALIFAVVGKPVGID